MHVESATKSQGAFFAGKGVLSYGAIEASFEAKTSAERVAGIRSRRRVVGSDGNCVRDSTDRRYTLARDRTASGNYARRGGNLRRQLGDLLRLRQGKRPDASGRNTICMGLSGLSGLRLPSLPSLPRLWVRRLRVRLLCVMGCLPLVLGSGTYRLR